MQFNLKLEPDELPTFIQQIENTLGQPSLIALPRASAVVSEVKNLELDKKLVDAIVGPAAPDVQAQEAVVSGVEFIFNNKNEYRFIYKGGSYDVDGELDVESLKSFLQDESVNLAEALNEIRLEFQTRMVKDKPRH